MAKTKTTKIGAGELTESITLLSTTPVAKTVTSLTRVGAVATVITATAHGAASGDFVTHAGAAQADYNIEAPVTVLNATSYTYAVGGTPATPATGTITALWVSDPQGGGGSGLYTGDTVWAQIEPLSAGEQLASGGIAAIGFFKCVLYYRVDIKPTGKLLWRRYKETAARTYEIHSVQPMADDGRRMLQIEMGIVE